MKKRSVQVGSLWQRKDTKYNNLLYIVLEIIKHPYAADSVTIKDIQKTHLPDGEINISIDYLKEDFRRIA